MTEERKIFLSYSRLDQDFALDLGRDLKNAGVKLWMDQLDGIVAGVDWRRAIEEAVDTSVGMVAVLSPEYVASEYCRNELARANDQKLPIFPLLLRSISTLPIEVQRLQYVDFQNWVDPHVYQAKLDELLSQLRQRAGAHVGDLPDTETRFLTGLISELQRRRGVQAYVELAAEAPSEPNDATILQRPRVMEEWGLDGQKGSSLRLTLAWASIGGDVIDNIEILLGTKNNSSYLTKSLFTIYSSILNHSLQPTVTVHLQP